MIKKRPFLLARARQLPPLAALSGHYDHREQLNLSFVAGQVRPLVMDASAAWTSSKTETVPGDDDPDPEGEECY